ncbi:uncharacterized protein BDZ99DRAFT_514196 [Mytilinidion resinicola]|uniref:Ankyrin n=1 Tax=Mytilinidion resinicola TaxID=574789 RepID=A0A6A6ZCD8_9PEZI|nr:uncharacterized protein BDZ99DRAFT_514196 [Mytilinidion resinicola]KAF2817975.1 hypothetical protein BDZ99DRAFT_514196 [Mytilinidion resinicola]
MSHPAANLSVFLQDKSWQYPTYPLPTTDSLTGLDLAAIYGRKFFVRRTLRENPSVLQRRCQRPLLDYALRGLNMQVVESGALKSRIFYVHHPYRVVEELLAHGADPNQKMALYHGQTVWGMFLCSLWELVSEFYEYSLPRWLKVVRILLEHGADPDLRFVFSPEGAVTAPNSGYCSAKDLDDSG